MTAPTLHLRAAQWRDVAALAAVSAADRDGWTANQFADELSVTVSRTLVATQLCLSAVTAPTLVGGIVFWQVADTLQIHNLVTHLQWRRQGVASTLLAAALAAGHKTGCTTVWLEVRADNGSAIALYRQFGFAVAGQRSAYYAGSGADALVMVGSPACHAVTSRHVPRR